ncbi:hypothetical protein LA76x_3735 [Lysobacter antibioticus]|uniref:Uncharacterized protein n=1 Tax=Lysobacter antibioticus TaxID=84531 RepID=A0A0S2FE93_LYSAN|nr:hypothetical protein LA76x_3735 [Lysobacter antibioticus]
MTLAHGNLPVLSNESVGRRGTAAATRRRLRHPNPGRARRYGSKVT